MSTRRDVATPLDLAAAQSLNAHRALGRMSACKDVAEFGAAAAELMNAAREISKSIATLARTSARDASSERRRAFTAWFATQVTTVLSHPMQSELQRTTGAPAVYLLRIARGSGPPPIREAMTLARMMSVPPRPEDFYFEGADKRPAIELCSEYLERVTNLLDQSKQAMKRFRLE